MATTNFRIGSIGIYTDYESAKADIANGNDSNNAFLKRFSTYTCRNAFNYASDPSRGSDFALINDEETIEAKYIPTVSFTFNAITPEVYSWFIQVVNTRKFFVRYYDYEIQRDVIRKMYMSEKDLQRVQFGSPNSWDIDDDDSVMKNQYGYILRLIGLSVTFVSHYGYNSYEPKTAPADVAIASAISAGRIFGNLPSLSSISAFVATPIRVPRVSNKSTNRNEKMITMKLKIPTSVMSMLKH